MGAGSASNQIHQVIPQTSTTICTNHIVGFQGLVLNSPIRVCLLQSACDVIVVLLDIDEFRAQFDLASESLEVVSEDTLGSALTEENRIQLTIAKESDQPPRKVPVSGNQLTYGHSGVGTINGEMSKTEITWLNPDPSSQVLISGTGMCSLIISSRTPRVLYNSIERG